MHFKYINRLDCSFVVVVVGYVYVYLFILGDDVIFRRKRVCLLFIYYYIVTLLYNMCKGLIKLQYD